MKRSLLLLLVMSTCACTSHTAAAQTSDKPSPRWSNLTSNWRFLQFDAPGAEQPTFDDSAWQTVSVPHDWSIAQPFDKDNKSGGAGAFLPGGVAFYRLHVHLPKADAGQRIFIDFDGVMAHSKVWLNGKLLGERPNGYVSFGYELTDAAHFGEDNILAVRTDTSQQPASRWYEGAGIYRPVYLIVEDPIHVAHWGTYITTPEVSASRAKIHLQVTVANQSPQSASTRVLVQLIEPGGRKIAAQAASTAQTLASRTEGIFNIDTVIPSPDRWDINHPAIYGAIVTVEANGQPSDVAVESFGIREFHFDPATGFWLNGKNYQALRRLPPQRCRSLRHRRSHRSLSRSPQSPASPRRQRHPHRAQPALTRVPRSRRQLGPPRHGRNVRHVVGGQKQV